MTTDAPPRGAKVVAAILVSVLLVAQGTSATNVTLSSSMLLLLEAANFSGPASVWIGNATERVGAAQNGYQNRAAGIPVKLDTRYPVASNTKLYVTIALYQLQERGHVNLSDSVANYLDQSDFAQFGYPNQTRYCPVVGPDGVDCQTVTFIQLLSMSAGLPNTAGLQFMPYPGSIAAFVGWFIQTPLLFPPGSQYYYSNPSFMLSAYFVEKFSGMSFEAFLKANIFDVVGMKDTYYDPYNGKFFLDEKRTLEYYEFVDPVSKQLLSVGTCSSEYDMGSANGAGGIVSSQADEARLYFSLFNFTRMGQPLLQQPQSLMDIVKPRTFISSGFYYAQGLFVFANSTLQPIPDRISYEGEIVCSHTLNFFYATRSPQVLIQAWSAVRVAYVNLTTLTDAAAARSGNFFSVFGSFNQRTTEGELAASIANLLGL